MNKRKFKINPFILIGSILLIFVLIGGLGEGGSIGGGIGDIFEEKQSVECNTKIKLGIFDRWTDARFDSTNCIVTGPCYGLQSTIQSWVQPSGNLVLTAGEQSKQKDYKIEALSSSDKVTISICTDASEGVLSLKDEDGNTIDSREVSW